MTLRTDNSRRNGRTASREARRRQLISATIDSIAKRGFTDTTLATVTKGAKLSHGTINFHFRSKELLFIETFKFLAEEYSDNWRAALEKAGATPRERLAAMIDADFDPAICNGKKVAVWFAFLGDRKYRPAYLDICEENDLERLGELERLCRSVNKDGEYGHDDPSVIARGLESLIDGLWLNMLVNPKSYRRNDARRTCFAFLAAVFPRHFPPVDDPAG
jgi:TetR/AcrR family transcriptional repressor of bet genes